MNDGSCGLPNQWRVAENPIVASQHSVTPEELLGPLDAVDRKHAPKQLFVSGDLALLRNGPRVSVVGSRKATGAGILRTRKLVRLLVEHGAVVVSGLAEGIDTTAHTEAIEAGGSTVAVLGTPLDQYFPTKNKALQQRIEREHLVVTQFAWGSSAGKRAFPMRNRTMALLADATVIIEAGERSGTIYQGWEALRLGRTLCILESLAKAGPSWCQEMLGYGAQVLSESTREAFFQNLPTGSRAERLEASF